MGRYHAVSLIQLGYGGVDFLSYMGERRTLIEELLPLVLWADS